ncbi:hypothetical protein C8R44DRAFT_934498 [Mycena epipterygia]|nr:hypothetical protein C8R44DRAFT_934498 [Mycena epipterygia]
MQAVKIAEEEGAIDNKISAGKRAVGNSRRAIGWEAVRAVPLAGARLSARQGIGRGRGKAITAESVAESGLRGVYSKHELSCLVSLRLHGLHVMMWITGISPCGHTDALNLAPPQISLRCTRFIYAGPRYSSFFLPMHRGRDPRVSLAALTRQRSEERCRRYSPDARTPPLAASRSPSPPSDASLSPRSPRSRSPTPPLTLSDQVHIAYAHDDIHLAKVLLLRLQGIEVTSDSDPRIAAVKDEDFDACFIPFGRLDDGRGDLKSKPPPVAMPPDTREADARRADALREKERLWETEARRFAEERSRCTALKRRQSDHLRTVSIEQERVRLIKQKEAAAAVVDLRRRKMKPTARTLNFSLVSPMPQPPSKFTYDFPFTPRNITPRAVPALRRSPIPQEPRAEPQQSPTREPNRVTFQQVLAAMHGPLFALPSERTITLSANPKARRQRALLDALLAAVDIDTATRKGKGKARVVSPVGCPVCSPCTPPTPMPSPPLPSGLSRAGSWLSFASSSSSSSTTSSRTSTISTSTAASSWVSASTILSPSSPEAEFAAPWLPGAQRTASPTPSLSTSSSTSPPSSASTSSASSPVLVPRAPRSIPRCACHAARRPASTHPLAPPPPAPRTPPAREHRALPLTLALGRLVALARNLQAAYVRAVLVGYGGVSAEWESEGDEYAYQGDRRVESYEYADPDARDAPREKEKEKEKEEKRVRDTPTARLTSSLRPRPVGARACRADVGRFLALSASSSPSSSSTISASASSSSSSSSPTSSSSSSPHTADADEDDETPVPVARLTPLAPRRPSGSSAGRRTALPATYACVFAPPVPLPRSPWAPRLAAVGCEDPTSPSASDVHEESGAGPYDAHSDADRPHPAPARRARAVPNSAFLRLKALHNAAAAVAVNVRRHEYEYEGQGQKVEVAPLYSAKVKGGVNANVKGANAPNASAPRPTNASATPNANAANASANPNASAKASLPAGPAAPRRPRECVVGVGVDRVPGSGLRNADARLDQYAHEYRESRPDAHEFEPDRTRGAHEAAPVSSSPAPMVTSPTAPEGDKGTSHPRTHNSKPRKKRRVQGCREGCVRAPGMRRVLRAPEDADGCILRLGLTMDGNISQRGDGWDAAESCPGEPRCLSRCGLSFGAESRPGRTGRMCVRCRTEFKMIEPGAPVPQVGKPERKAKEEKEAEDKLEVLEKEKDWNGTQGTNGGGQPLRDSPKSRGFFAFISDTLQLHYTISTTLITLYEGTTNNACIYGEKETLPVVTSFGLGLRRAVAPTPK